MASACERAPAPRGVCSRDGVVDSEPELREGRVDAGFADARHTRGDAPTVARRERARGQMQIAALRRRPADRRGGHVVGAAVATAIGTAAVTLDQPERAGSDPGGRGIGAGRDRADGVERRVAPHAKPHAVPCEGRARACDCPHARRDARRLGLPRCRDEQQRDRQTPARRMAGSPPASLDRPRRSRHRFLLGIAARSERSRRCRSRSTEGAEVAIRGMPQKGGGVLRSRPIVRKRRDADDRVRAGHARAARARRRA